MNIENLTQSIEDSAQKVYRQLGWGWQESVYREALVRELGENGLICQEEIPSPIYYNGYPLSNVNCRLDILATEPKSKLEVIIELKADAATKMTMIKAYQQCLRYLNNTKKTYGMVINFPEKNNRQVETIRIPQENPLLEEVKEKPAKKPKGKKKKDKNKLTQFIESMEKNS